MSSSCCLTSENSSSSLCFSSWSPHQWWHGVNYRVIKETKEQILHNIKNLCLIKNSNKWCLNVQCISDIICCSSGVSLKEALTSSLSRRSLSWFSWLFDCWMMLLKLVIWVSRLQTWPRSCSLTRLSSWTWEWFFFCSASTSLFFWAKPATFYVGETWIADSMLNQSQTKNLSIFSFFLPFLMISF